MGNSIALCIPAYNAAWCLPRLLESAKNQEIPFDEILVYNDCSTDQTEEIALQFGATVINGITNKGCSYGKNELAKIAKSSWLHFHDADDELSENFTSIAHKWIDQPNCADIILLNFDYRDQETNELIAQANYNKIELKKDSKKFAINNKLVNFAIVNKFKFNAIGGFNTQINMLYNEDRAFYSRAIVHNLSFDYEEEITCINYKQVNSMSASNLLKCTWAHFYVSQYLEENLGDNYPQDIAKCYWQNAAIAASFEEWPLVKSSLKHAIKLDRQVVSTNDSSLFNQLCKVNPFGAFWFREKMIRWFKPHLRS